MKKKIVYYSMKIFLYLTRDKNDDDDDESIF